MKIHKPLLFAIVRVIQQVFADGQMADKAIQRELRSDKRWGSKDRAFIASYSYEMVRWWRLLHFINETNIHQHEESTVWRLLGIILRLDELTLPEMDQFRGLNRKKIKERYELAQETRKIRESIPDWLDEIGHKSLGEQWDEEVHALNKEARVGIRTNTLKTEKEVLQIALRKEQIETDSIIGVEDGLYLEDRKNLFNTKAFRAGHFEVQDPGSQMIGAFLDVQPDMRVIDACAGAGGKSLHLSALMQNKGTLISMDVYEWKLKELKRRAKRAGAHNIDTRHIKNNKVIKRLYESADRLLLDVPCSGTGVLRRNPDAKWKLDSAFLERVQITQEEILANYTTMLKPGGKLVYATCSILSSENRDQVNKFLSKNSNFTLINEHQTFPSKDGFDGFYMALIQKA